MKKNYLILKISFIFLFLNAAPIFAQTAPQFTHLGNMDGRAEKYKEAILNYTKAIKVDPNFANAYYNRGFIYIKVRKYRLAMADLNKAIELKPAYAAAYHVRGIAEFSTKKYDQAIADYRKALELDPDNVRFHISILSAYFKTGNNDRSWKEVIKIEKLGGTVNPDIINLLKNKKYRDRN